MRRWLARAKYRWRKHWRIWNWVKVQWSSSGKAQGKRDWAVFWISMWLFNMYLDFALPFDDQLQNKVIRIESIPVKNVGFCMTKKKFRKPRLITHLETISSSEHNRGIAMRKFDDDSRICSGTVRYKMRACRCVSLLWCPSNHFLSLIKVWEMIGTTQDPFEHGRWKQVFIECACSEWLGNKQEERVQSTPLLWRSTF